MEKSTHVCEVVPVVLLKHPNADTLSIVSVFDGGYQVVVRTDDWMGKNIGAYLPPDSVVPDTVEYAYLLGHLRIKARRFRGAWSMGLLVDAPKGSKIGDNVADILGIKHYEPPIKCSMGNNSPNKKSQWKMVFKLLIHGRFRVAWMVFKQALRRDFVTRPNTPAPDYDVDALRRYREVFQEGEPVYVTEKIHGTNARYVLHKGRMFCGSHHKWVRNCGSECFHDKVQNKNVYWRALDVCPGIEKFCRTYPNLVIYGEIYGVQDGYNYGLNTGEVGFVAFDIYDPELEMRYVSVDQFLGFCLTFDIPHVPYLCTNVPYKFEIMEEYSNNLKSHIVGAKHIAEGVVIKPQVERRHPLIGRCQLKLVSNKYLEQSKDE